jgi:hypothetical protein
MISPSLFNFFWWDLNSASNFVNFATVFINELVYLSIFDAVLVDVTVLVPVYKNIT